MKRVNIGLLGAVINNGNMGCIALTYSLLKLLEGISKEKGIVFYYYIFEGRSDDKRIQSASQQLSIDKERLISVPVFYLYKNKTVIHYPLKAFRVMKNIEKCELFIDMTSGDSFTDIYGDVRFNSTTRIKEIVEKKGKKLILGPQTYGPFNKSSNRDRARKAIENASCVIARDELSAEYLSTFTDKKVSVTTDLAFMLPYDKPESKADDTVRIGVNISSLLVKNKTEDTVVNFKLKTDYDLFIKKLLESLCSDNRYEIHIIPHVSKDAGAQFSKYCPDAIIVDEFSSPIDAKNYIAGMDIFIGARMHATIGAFSSGVATIPTAYSRKFKGLYESLGYKYVVDLAEKDTDEAVKLTLKYVENYKELKKAGCEGLKAAQNKSELTKKIFSEQIDDFLKQR